MPLNKETKPNQNIAKLLTCLNIIKFVYFILIFVFWLEEFLHLRKKVNAWKNGYQIKRPCIISSLFFNWFNFRNIIFTRVIQKIKKNIAEEVGNGETLINKSFIPHHSFFSYFSSISFLSFFLLSFLK